MVLQRAPQKAVIWGFGDSGKLTTLHIDNKIYMQTIIGHGIYPKISPSKKINKIKKAGNKG